MPRYFAVAPVAMISASAVYSPRVALQPERALRQVGGVDVVEDDFGVEALGVRLHALHQRRAHQAVRVAGPVVDFGGRHQLAALLQAGDHHRLEVGARGVDGGGPAGRAGAEDEQGDSASQWSCMGRPIKGVRVRCATGFSSSCRVSRNRMAAGPTTTQGAHCAVPHDSPHTNTSRTACGSASPRKPRPSKAASRWCRPPQATSSSVATKCGWSRAPA